MHAARALGVDCVMLHVERSTFNICAADACVHTRCQRCGRCGWRLVWLLRMPARPGAPQADNTITAADRSGSRLANHSCQHNQLATAHLRVHQPLNARQRQMCQVPPTPHFKLDAGSKVPCSGTAVLQLHQLLQVTHDCRHASKSIAMLGGLQRQQQPLVGNREAV